MKIIRSSSRLLSLFLALCLLINPTLYCYDSAYLDQVANNNLSTFKVVDKESDDLKVKPIGQQDFTDLLCALITPRHFQIQDLNARDKRETSFKQVPYHPESSEPVIDISFVKKMELVHGDTRVEDHLAHFVTTYKTFDLIATEFGKKRCVEIITQPTCNIDLLKQRQAIIKELVANDELRNQCDKILIQIRKSEALLFDLYQYEELPESEKILYFNNFWNSFGLNDSSIALSLSTRLGQLLGAGTSALYATVFPNFFSRIAGYGTFGTNAMRIGMGTPLFVILASLHKQMINMTKNIQEKMIGTAAYINGTKRLIKLFGKNTQIMANMPHLKTNAKILLQSNNKSAEFNELLDLLNKSAFTPGQPSAFSSPGHVLRAYSHMIKETIRREFSEVLNLLGDIDLYVALAKKITIHQKTDAHYSFVQFSASSSPSISATRFWNPFLNDETVVTNTIEFNAENMRSMILTGPNTGGKSTAIKALMANALLAQTFGIAPADQLIMTLFAKLTCHMNITDDTAGGVSLFKAEVQRAHDLIDMIRKLGKHELAFIIIDEIFTGTSPQQAEELSYKFIKQLAEFPNLIFIDATHFKKLTELEQETHGSCKNYHMGAETDETGKVLKYTYTLTQGPSPISNAAQIAEEEGIF